MIAAATDANQPEIIAAYRKVGATVTSLHRVGMGCPDLMVGYRGKTYLVEVKDGSKPPSARQLTPPQKKWHANWNGHVAIVTNVDEALAVIGIGALVSIPVRGVIS